MFELFPANDFSIEWPLLPLQWFGSNYFRRALLGFTAFLERRYWTLCSAICGQPGPGLWHLFRLQGIEFDSK